MLVQLKQQLGDQWHFKLNQQLLTVISPQTNEIGDCFEVEIEFKHGRYEIDDNCDALNEFDLYQLPKTNAYQYLKTVPVKIDPHDEALIIQSDRHHLVDNILKLIQIQVDINQIQQQISRKLGRK